MVPYPTSWSLPSCTSQGCRGDQGIPQLRLQAQVTPFCCPCLVLPSELCLSVSALWWHPQDAPSWLSNLSPWLCEVPAASAHTAPSLILEESRGHQSPGGQMDRLLKAGNFLSSQQKQSRYYMCLREGPSSATHNTPVGMAGKV